MLEIRFEWTTEVFHDSVEHEWRVEIQAGEFSQYLARP